MPFFDTSIYNILKEGLIGSGATTLKMIMIVIPLMILLEFARHFLWIDKITSMFAPILKKIGLGYHATFPLLIGLSFGILYGSGVMIESVEEGELDKKEVSLILIFLVICHAIFEDTFIFWSVGGSFFILFFGRIIGAIIITGIFSKIIQKNNELDVNINTEQIQYCENEEKC